MELLLNVKEKGILPVICFFIFICVLVLSGCGRQEEENLQTEGQPSGGGGDYTLETKVTDVINDPVFEDYGRLIFPVDRTIDDNLTLQDVGEILVCCPEIAAEAVEVAVHQDQFSVRYPFECLDDPFLDCGVQGEVWSDHIVVIVAEPFVNVVFEQVDLLSVQADFHFAAVAYRGREGTEKHILVGAKFVEQHQDFRLAKFPCCNIESLSLD